MGLKSTDIISRSSRIAGRLFEERMLVITAADSMLHRFNEAGTFIWQQLESPRTVEDLCAAVTDHFDGFDLKKNTSDIRHFLEVLQKKGCIEVNPAAGG